MNHRPRLKARGTSTFCSFTKRPSALPGSTEGSEFLQTLPKKAPVEGTRKVLLRKGFPYSLTSVLCVLSGLYILFDLARTIQQPGDFLIKTQEDAPPHKEPRKSCSSLARKVPAHWLQPVAAGGKSRNNHIETVQNGFQTL